MMKKINEKGRGKHVAPIMSGSHISVSFADPNLRAIGRVDEKNKHSKLGTHIKSIYIYIYHDLSTLLELLS